MAPSDYLLDSEDLAYMREEQTRVRPTACTLTPAGRSTSDGMGGRTPSSGDPFPIQARITHLKSRNFLRDVPQDIADRYDVSVLVRIHLDLTPVHVGDLLVEDANPTRRYQIVSEGTIADEWATAQTVWGVAQ